MKDRFTTLLVSRGAQLKSCTILPVYWNKQPRSDTKHSEKHKYKINIISYLSAIYHSPSTVCAVLRLFGAPPRKNVKSLHDPMDGFDFHVWFTILVSDEKWFFKRLFQLLTRSILLNSPTVARRRCSWVEFFMHIVNGLNVLFCVVVYWLRAAVSRRGKTPENLNLKPFLGSRSYNIDLISESLI